MEVKGKDESCRARKTVRGMLFAARQTRILGRRLPNGWPARRRAPWQPLYLRTAV